MSTKKRAFILFFPALLLVSLLPLFPSYSMTRSQVMGHGGDVISYHFEFESMPTFVDNLKYARPEEHAGLNLGANVALAVLFAAVLAFVGARLWSGRVVKAP